MTVKTRFAPSPTGHLHIGSVRTALFSWLFARSHGGKFVLRIEDTDKERSTIEFTSAIIEGMNWLGLIADEGPVHQLNRLERYREVLKQWIADGLAYHCYCTAEELEEMRAERVRNDKNPGYDGRCRERAAPRAGVDPVIRFRHPTHGQIIVNDLVRGPVKFENSQFDDLIIARSNGVPTYNFSVVVDDSDMDITHVIRGDDHLNNTPKQINMLAALGKSPPEYAHLPMILGSDGSRLSKRHGAVNVLDYRDQGYLPEALLNYLVRLGWSHGDQEVFSIDEMIQYFDLGDVNASASSFDPEKLNWINQQYIINTDSEKLADILSQQLEAIGIDENSGPATMDVVDAYRERATTMYEMAQSCVYCYEDFEQIDPKAAKKHLRPIVLEPLKEILDRFSSLTNWTAEALEVEIHAIASKFDFNMGKIGQPIRVAVTGGSVSPPIDVTLTLIGRNRVLSRLANAVAMIEDRASN